MTLPTAVVVWLPAMSLRVPVHLALHVPRRMFCLPLAQRGLQLPSSAKEGGGLRVSVADCAERCQAYDIAGGISAALALNGSGNEKAGGTNAFRRYLRPPSASLQWAGVNIQRPKDVDPRMLLLIVKACPVSPAAVQRSPFIRTAECWITCLAGCDYGHDCE